VINNGRDGGETGAHLHCHIWATRAGLAARMRAGLIIFCKGKLIEALPRSDGGVQRVGMRR